jgi:hypothetical protein
MRLSFLVSISAFYATLFPLNSSYHVGTMPHAFARLLDVKCEWSLNGMCSVCLRYNVCCFYLFVDPPTYSCRCQFLLHPVSSGVLRLTRVPPQSSALHHHRCWPCTHPTFTSKHSSTPATGTQPTCIRTLTPLAGVLPAPASMHSYSDLHLKHVFCVLPILIPLHTLCTDTPTPALTYTLPAPPRMTKSILFLPMSISACKSPVTAEKAKLSGRGGHRPCFVQCGDWGLGQEWARTACAFCTLCSLAACVL